MSRLRPVAVEVIRGTPVPVLDRTITPVVRAVSAVRRRGTIRNARVEGEAWCVALTRPVAIVEERYGDTRVLKIPDVTRRVLTSMALVAALFPLLALVLVRLNRAMRRG